MGIPALLGVARSSFRPSGSYTPSTGLDSPEPWGTQEPLWEASNAILADGAKVEKSLDERYPCAQAPAKDASFIPKAFERGLLTRVVR